MPQASRLRIFLCVLRDTNVDSSWDESHVLVFVDWEVVWREVSLRVLNIYLTYSQGLGKKMMLLMMLSLTLSKYKLEETKAL